MMMMKMMMVVVVVVYVVLCLSACFSDRFASLKTFSCGIHESRRLSSTGTARLHRRRCAILVTWVCLGLSRAMSGWALELEGCRKQIWEFSKQHQIEYDTSRNNLGNWSQSVSSGLVTAVCTSFEYFRMSCFGVKANTTEASGGSAFCKAADG